MSRPKWDSSGEPQKKDPKIPKMTLMVDLPSKGLYYPEDSFLHKEEQVEIKYVSGLEEAILTNKEYARNGVTIDKFVTSLILDERIKFPVVMNSLLLSDITAIAIAGRNSAYGDNYSVKVTCPRCGQSEDVDFNFSDLPTSSGFFDHEDKLCDQVEHIGVDRFLIKSTPLLNDRVGFRMLNHKDELNMRKILRTKKNITFKEQYLPLIVSVNDQTDVKNISEYLDNAPAYDLKYVRNLINKCTPSVDLKKEYTCSSCGFSKDDFEVPITENFFMSL
jgi:predicted RNA-binding Zn-ribbon protein involved in translation (DUF1610 family)